MQYQETGGATATTHAHPPGAGGEPRDDPPELGTDARPPGKRAAPEEAIRAYLAALDHKAAGGVTEVCVFQGGKPSHVGYFGDIDKAAKAILQHDGAGNIFVTLNAAKSALLARVNNRLKKGSYNDPAERTKDHEIHCDSWFPGRIDPERPRNISSTDDEHREALELGRDVRDWLLSVGVPAAAIMTGDSGNGAYLLIRTPDVPIKDNDEETKAHIALKTAFLNFIADKFDIEGRVKIDRSERKRRMWERRFAILRIMHSTDGDLPHGGQQRLAERFGVHKCVISRDVAWARRIGWLGDGFTLRCSYRRGAVTIEWTNTAVNLIMRNARQLLKAAKRDKLE